MSDQGTLIDYEPSQAEEIARLTKLVETKNAQVEAILNDPVFQQAEAKTKVLDKKIKEIEKVRNDLSKIIGKIDEIHTLKVAEPVEEGFYLFTKAERGYRRDNSIRIRKSILLKAFGEWFDLDGNSNTLPRWDGKAVDFNDFLDIDEGTIEATLTKLEDTSRWPKELLEDEDVAGTDEDDPTPLLKDSEVEADDTESEEGEL